MTIEAGSNAPYAPPTAVVELLSRYRDRGLSVPITTDVVERAGVSPTLSRRTVQTLKLLGFIDNEGMPSSELEAMSRAPEGQYKQMLGEYLAGVYKEVFAFADPATDPYDRVRDAFRSFDPRGQQDRMVTLFLGLLEFAGVDISAAVASRKRTDTAADKKKATGSTKKAAGASTGTKADKKGSTGQSAPPADSGVLPPGLVGLLQQIPRDGKPWTTERRDAFLAAFRAVLDFTIPIGNEADAQAEDSS